MLRRQKQNPLGMRGRKGDDRDQQRAIGTKDVAAITYNFEANSIPAAVVAWSSAAQGPSKDWRNARTGAKMKLCSVLLTDVAGVHGKNVYFGHVGR